MKIHYPIISGTSQGVQNFWLTILCKYIKGKTTYNKGVTRTEDCLFTSHSTMLMVVRLSPTQFYMWQKTGYGIRYFLSFETENWKCWLLRHYLNFLCELNFIGQQIFNVSPWTTNCPNLYTHETHQPNLTYIQIVLNQLSLKYIGSKIWSNIPEKLKSSSPYSFGKK